MRKTPTYSNGNLGLSYVLSLESYHRELMVPLEYTSRRKSFTTRRARAGFQSALLLEVCEERDSNRIR